jgi:lactate permease
MWNQVYNPFSNEALSTLVAAIPVVTLLALIASARSRRTRRGIALVVAMFIAVEAFTMPVGMTIRASVLGCGPVLSHRLDRAQRHLPLPADGGERRFQTLQQTIGGVTADRRLQLLLIAFSFGAFFEGASGFGTPVAVTGAILIGLGFSPLAASGLSLIANTAPVAYGALGTPDRRARAGDRLDPFSSARWSAGSFRSSR